MIHQVLVRDLNSLANQLVQGSFLQKKLQKTVLDAVDLGLGTLDFDDEKRENKQLLQLIADAVSKERSVNESRSSVIRRETKDDEENVKDSKQSRFGKRKV